MKIILLTGPAGSGKTQVAHHLIGLGYAPNKFAYPLKQFCKDYLRLTEDEVNGDKKELPLERYNNRTPREIQQTMGTDWGREMVDPDIWVKAAFYSVQRDVAYNDQTKFVFDDTRFQNEIDIFRDSYPRDTTVINIIPDYPDYEPISASDHASETQALHWDKQIRNNGTLEELMMKVEAEL